MEDRNDFNGYENKIPEEEATYYAEDNKSFSESSQNMQEEFSSEVQADDTQEESDKSKSESAQETAGDSERPLQSNHIEADTSEYVWNSTESSGYTYSSPYGYSHTYDSSEYGEDKKTKSRGRKTLFIALVAVVVLMALVVGGTAGYIISTMSFDAQQNTDNDPEDTQTINIIKNDDPIQVHVEPGAKENKELSRSEVVDLVADAVVEITTSKVQTNSFFGGNYVTSGAGSGVVIAQSDKYAYIVTNYHVIAGASSVNVTFTDRTVVEAQYLDGDVNNDIAMLRIETDKKFSEIAIGSSDNLKVGQDVIVIGNPLGQLGGTVTEGIVSALDRKISIDGVSMTLIQTSAAVNPGNSGGGMFDMAGRLVGIVNAKTSAEGIEGLGFAIPIDSVYDMLIEIIENKYIHGRPTLGIEVRYVTDTWTARIEYGVGVTGIFVTSSSNDKILAKDLIRSINGQLVSDSSSYATAVASLTVGDMVTVELYRQGKLTTVEVEVTEYVPTRMFG